jgi:hypothetical protein
MVEMITTVAAAKESTFHAVRRRLAALMPDGVPVAAPAALEHVSRGVVDVPTVRPATVIEKGAAGSKPVSPAPTRFAAFLDGAQWSLVAAWIDGVPIVHGTVAAVVRQRRERRLTTWSGPIVRRALYAPMALLPQHTRDALGTGGIDIVDTLERRTSDSSHPLALQDLAYQVILGRREAAEQELAEQWCATSPEPLFVDGSIAGSRQVARAGAAVGVIKSHQTLHADGDALHSLLTLPTAHRTAVSRVDSGQREPVASWYLRLRDPVGHDPLWGLVRVEVALQRDTQQDALARRADEVSGWVLSEVVPLAVPDARWDKMVYGVRDCEEFLRAIR